MAPRSPIPTLPPLIPGRQTHSWLWAAAAAELWGLQGRLENGLCFHNELRHEARELLVYMGNVGLGDVMASRATPAQSQPQSFEAHRKRDKQSCFLSQEHSDTSELGLPSARGELSPSHPHEGGMDSAEHLRVKHGMACCGLGRWQGCTASGMKPEQDRASLGGEGQSQAELG